MTELLNDTPSLNNANVLSLNTFIDEFGDSLLDSLNQSHPPVYRGVPDLRRQSVMNNLKRVPFPAQAETVQAVTKLLVEQNEHAAIINGEMGCGKTLLAIATAAVLYEEGYRRTLVLSPPHLVYKWRREILDTVANARVWILNGPDTLAKLMLLREQLNIPATGPEFFILGRVRMRMGYHWKPACTVKRLPGGELFALCPDCGKPVTDHDSSWLTAEALQREERPRKCLHCNTPLWTLIRPGQTSASEQCRVVQKSLCRIPTIGTATAGKLLNKFGSEFLASMLGDNLYEFINLMDGNGELVFSDRQALRMERALANIEFGFGEGGYQPSEYIKRYLPQNAFDLFVVDEGHEYKSADSAQGLAMDVLASKARKVLLLTGTLMGGYADDIYYLLFRILTHRMLEEGYRPGRNGSLRAGAMRFMQDHGVLKEIHSESSSTAYKTSKGKKNSVRVSKAPGFGPKGILRCLLPYTAFLKLSDMGKILPPYHEELREIDMTAEQQEAYTALSSQLTTLLKQALKKRDNTLLGVVLNALLAWPECCFRAETVKHPPHTGNPGVCSITV